MFGGFGAGRAMGQYNKAKEEDQKLPKVEVSEKEFVNLLVASGVAKKDAKLQANLAKGLGSSVRIGDKLVSVKRA